MHPLKRSPRAFLTLAVLVLSLGMGTCGKSSDNFGTIEGSWQFRSDAKSAGVQEGWMGQVGDSSEWVPIRVPGPWEDLAEYAAFDGVGWYRATFRSPDFNEPWAVLFEGVDDDATVWLNGTELGTHIGHTDPFVLEAGTVGLVGENQLVVRVADHGGQGGILRPVRLIPSSQKSNVLRSPLADRSARHSESWVKEAVIYEVYLRSFSKEGSFRALESRLPELKDLGVTVLWLMPIHPVGELNRKGSLGSPYSVRDYNSVNDEFGSADDFRSLVSAAHAHGMKLIIDLVVNHTSWDNQMLVEHPEWYTTNEDGAIVAPNPDWSDVADLNYDGHELRKTMVSMMRHWVQDYDIDGFRCDVAEMVPTDFWETARRELEKVKSVMMLSEGSWPEHHLSAFDVTYAWTVYDILDPILRGQMPASRISETIEREGYRFPKGSLRMRFNTNHDKNAWDAPAVTKFGHDGAMLTAAIVFSLPGVPLIYNGEEVGNPKRLNLFEKVDIDWKDGKKFRELYRQLTALRRADPWLATGSYEPLIHNGGSSVLVFARRPEQGPGLIIGAFNFGSVTARIAIPDSVAGEGTWMARVGRKGRIDLGDLEIPAKGFVIAEQAQ